MRERILEMMLHREWNPGASHKGLAKEWGVAPRTVADRALEASRAIRLASKKPVEDFVAEAFAELDALIQEARALGKPRDAAYCIELKAKMLGAFAPTKTETKDTTEPLPDDELEAKLEEALAKVKERRREKLNGNGAGSNGVH
jgi:hypothetical protein